MKQIKQCEKLRLTIFSDSHSNLKALKATFEDHLLNLLVMSVIYKYYAF